MEEISVVLTYLVHNFSHITNHWVHSDFNFQILFVFFVFRKQSTEENHNKCTRFGFVEATGEWVVTLVSDKRAPDLHWFTSYSLFGPLCLGTGKTLKLSKLNNWPDSMMCSQMITSRSPFYSSSTSSLSE